MAVTIDAIMQETGKRFVMTNSNSCVVVMSRAGQDWKES